MSSSSNILLLLWFPMLLGSACSNKEQVHDPISLESVKSISKLNDSTFIDNVGSIKSSNNHLFLSLHHNLVQVIQLGSDMNLIGRINKYGKGPGEFIAIEDISIVNDSLYLYDDNQAKILIYDGNNNFTREVRVPEASGFNLVVDNRIHMFLSTPNQENPITKFNANGQEIVAFGNKTVSEDSRHFLRNSRFLFIHNDKLIAIGRSEPVLEVYSLEGKLIRKATITPPAMHESIVRVKEKNEGRGVQPNVTFLSNLFYDVTIHKNILYLMEAKSTKENSNTYDAKFTYLFKYLLEPNGDVSHEQTYKLFHSDRDKLMYGFKLAAVDDHKLVVYDMMGKSLLVYEDERL